MAWTPLGRAITKRAEKLLEEYRSVSFQSVWGSARDVTTATDNTMAHALTLAAVYSATSLIGDLVSGFPLESFSTSTGVDQLMVPPTPLVANPTAFGTTTDWVHRCVVSMALKGNAYAYITETDRYGWPRRMELLHPEEVTIRSDRSVAPPQWFWLGKPIDNDLFVHIPLYSIPGRINGISPIRAYANTIDTSLMAQQFGKDFFVNGSTPAAVLETDKRVEEEDSDEIRDRFRKSAAGRNVVPLGLGLTYKQIQVNPDESQFLATIRGGATTVAAIYHLPPELVGGDSGASNTYANVEMRSTDIARFALSPYVTRIERKITDLTPRPQRARFNMDEFQRPDMMTRYSAYSLAIADGWLLRDEVRALENRAPLPDGMGAVVPPLGGVKVAAPSTVDEVDQPSDPTDNTPPSSPNAPMNDTSPLGNVPNGLVSQNSLNKTNGHTKLTGDQLKVLIRGRQDL